MNCNLTDLCKKVKCLEGEVEYLKDKANGLSENLYVFTGNIGAPAIQDIDGDVNQKARAALDEQDYNLGAGIINSFSPKGVFLVGGMNYDHFQTGQPYFAFNQEKKITDGFVSLYMQKKVWPVLGNFDYFPTVSGATFTPDPPGSGIPYQMGKTALRMFDYLPDARRYYSIYDDESNTEFFVLSSARYTDYVNKETSGFLGSLNDTLLYNDQYNWFFQRAGSSPARNKVVIFACPFVSTSYAMYGNDANGYVEVYNDFSEWDFESVGVKLIINGHSGSAFHLSRGSVNIVNSSAFLKSQFGLILAQFPGTLGQPGWVTQYQSQRPISEDAVPNVRYPDAGNPTEAYIVPKNEIVKLICTREGIKVQFVSYSTEEYNFKRAIDSIKVEHEFEVSALY